MNYALVCKLLSVVLCALTVALGASHGVAMWYDRGAGNESASRAFLVSALITALAALILYRVGRRSTNVMFRREALAVIGLGWISASLFGAIPYYLVLPVSAASAIFESTSGITTTGASVLSGLENLPRSLLFWRAISQWIGGLGVIVFFVAVLSFLGAGAKVLFSRESSAQAAELDTARVQKGIVRLVYLYLGLSLACTIVFLLCGLDLYDAVTHMFTTVSTGGFSTRSASIAAFENVALEWSIIFFMLLGGTSFIPMLRALRGDWPALVHSTEIRWYYGLALGGSLLIGLFLLFDVSFSYEFHTIARTAVFQVTSIITTTGFATDDFASWMPVTHVILLVLMGIGGCSGSTSGGAKVVRFAIAFRICLMHVEKAFRARVVRTLRVSGQPADAATQESVLVFLVLLGMVSVFGVVALAVLEPTTSTEGLISAAAACIFNIGPGFAEVGPMENFAHFGDFAKLLLSLLMILGRVELFAVLALFLPGLWRKF